jgi:hypothetical protein
MAADPFRETEERGAPGRPGTRLLRNADPSTDPNDNVHRLATTPARGPSRPDAMPASAQTERRSGERLGRAALLVLFALTVSLAVVFLVVSYTGEPDATAAGEPDHDLFRSNSPLAPAQPGRQSDSTSLALDSRLRGSDDSISNDNDRATGGRPEPTPLEAAAPLPARAPQPPAAADPPPRAALPSPPPAGETAGETLTAGEIRALRSRGEALFNTGDVAAARRLFERAALAGDDVAALRLGQSYDPAYLAGGRGRGVTGNLGMAIFWYRRGEELGNGTAAFLGRQLETAARARWRR